MRDLFRVLRIHSSPKTIYNDKLTMADKEKRRTETLLSRIFAIGLWIHIVVTQGSAEEFHWSDVTLQNQAGNLGCTLGNYYMTTVPKQRNNQTLLGKVADMEVCGMLCCELPECDTAWFQDKVCYSVACKDNVCETERATGTNQNSAVLQIKRKSQSGVKDRSKEVTGVKYDENKSTIVTKQALTSNNAKSSKDETLNAHQSTGNSDSKQESLVTISNQSPMEQLLQTESNIVHNKATAKEPASQKATETEAVKKSKDAALNTDIQSLSDHLKKVDDKLDMTAALEENDKRTIHPKLRYHKHHDLRHNLISPIIIGAFTCMAVIALSGFAMAIIKYQKERKERHLTQSTQTLESN
eukprot:Seg1123.7 transcript_id=Seg1123.7/GoldUCD/mRNA.D3Y31 product="hypothetical protein" protein_id=Seg1123.7/GoldUCD/D3Y31